MAIAEMFLWWYAQGWRVFVQRSRGWFSSVTDFFSMDSLIRTLFKPYRQISANTVSSGSLDLRFQMFLDRMVSRMIGFFTRFLLLLVGAVIILAGGLLDLVLIVIWPVIPFLPIVGIVMSIVGVAV